MATSDDDPILTRTYSGVLDDVMLRYGRGREFLSADFFNKMILKNVLFGSGIYLNDGYLVNHPIARRHLAEPDSLLRLMIGTGFIRILSREPDGDALATMPERMAQSDNQSFKTLVASDEWIGRLRPVFRQVAQAAFHDGRVRRWPGYDMSAGFCDLMDRVFAAEQAADVGLRHIDRATLTRIEDAFLAREPRAGNPRDKLEKAALEVLRARDGDAEAPMAEVMDVANQAYHYNFGLTLNAEDEVPVAADTTIGLAFDELLQTRRIERAQLDALPLLSFPKEIPLEDGEPFLPFIRADHPLYLAKLDYMRAIERLVSDTARDLTALAVDVREATEAYRRRMMEYFSRRYGKTDIDLAFDGSATFGMTVVGGPATATAAPSAHLAVALQRASRPENRAFLLTRFRVEDVTREFDGEMRQTISLGDVQSQLASLAFDEGAASRFVEALPSFASSGESGDV